MFLLLSRQGVLVAALAIYGLFFCLSLFNRYIQIDENWFGEQAWYLATEGVVRLGSMPGILDFDQHMYLYHKLLVWMGAGLTWVFGWSVFPFKFLALAFYGLFFWFYYRHHKLNPGTINRQVFLLACVLLVSIPIMLQQGFTFRPEVFVMCLGFASYYYLDKYLKYNVLHHAARAGLFAGLAFLITLNAVIFPLAGALLLLSRQRWRALLLFGGVAAAVGLFFFIDLWQEGKWDIFLYQARHWPSRKFGETYLGNGIFSFIGMKLLNLLNEHQRFFWSDRVMAFSALFWLALVFNFRYFYRQHGQLLFYTLSLVLCLSLSGSHAAERYLVFYYPFLALIAALGLPRAATLSWPYLKYLYLLLVLLNLASLTKQFAFVFHHNGPAASVHREILQALPDQQAVVFAPWQFIYNEIADYRIVNYQALQYYQDDLPEKLDQQDFLVLLKQKYGVKYLVLDDDICRDEAHDYDWLRAGFQDGRKPLFIHHGYRVYSLN